MKAVYIIGLLIGAVVVAGLIRQKNAKNTKQEAKEDLETLGYIAIPGIVPTPPPPPQYTRTKDPEIWNAFVETEVEEIDSDIVNQQIPDYSQHEYIPGQQG